MNNPLQVPFVERTQHLLLDTDSRKLNIEIRDLPYADIPSAVQMAYRRLHAFNRFSMPAAKRFELLRPFHYAYSRFIEHYRRHFAQGAFARELNPRELEHLAEFLLELAIGFKHLVHDALARNKKPSGIGLVLYMALNYLHYYALTSYNCGCLLAPSFWREVHYLYFSACQVNQHQSPLQAPDGRQVSIEHIYNQIILMGLCSPHSLSAEEHWRCHDYIARFAGLVAISATADHSAFEDAYSVHIDCEQPAEIPRLQNSLHRSACLLDLAQFVDNMQRHINALRNGESLRVIGMEHLQRKPVLDLLQKLQHNWTRNPARNSLRQVIQEQVGLVWGLENICAMLDPELRRQQSMLQHNQHSDHRTWALAENQSQNGLRVRLPHLGSVFPEAGQVVALIRQINQQKLLEIGLVQWCGLNSANEPTLGIECLLGRTTKVLIMPQDDQGMPRNGLLIIARTENGRARSLLMCPAGMLHPGTRVQVQSAQQIDVTHVEAFAAIHRTRQVETLEIRALR